MKKAIIIFLLAIAVIIGVANRELHHPDGNEVEAEASSLELKTKKASRSISSSFVLSQVKFMPRPYELSLAIALDPENIEQMSKSEIIL